MAVRNANKKTHNSTNNDGRHLYVRLRGSVAYTDCIHRAYIAYRSKEMASVI